MNCDQFQNRLLACERPEEPTVELRTHLATCSACRDYQRQVLSMEKELAAFSVPSSTVAKQETIRRILAEPLLVRPRSLSMSGQHHNGLVKDRGLRKMSVAFALAASLLLFAFGWWTMRPGKPRILGPEVAQRVDPFSRRMAELNPLWMDARTPRQRVEILDGIADELEKKAKESADNGDIAELETLVSLYKDVVNNDKGLLQQAGDLPARECRQVLEPITSRLLRSVEAFRMSIKDQSSPEAQEQLTIMSGVADRGHRELLVLMSKG